MNISYNWLKDLINIELSPSDLGQRLTGVGLAVEGIHGHGEDFVFDIDLTSNRPDCLSHLGVAREIGVITNTLLKASGNKEAGQPEIPLPAVLAGDVVRIDNAQLCQRFTARIIRNVNIGPSPQWMVDRLEAIGERSINNVADITNYVMHELGQPMHVFDLDKLDGKRIVVRHAHDGEAITTLDEATRKLSTEMLAICDADKPVAVAGIMGGLDSGITDLTTNVLLEVAFFKRENIRATSRKLNLNTEASYRFERGVDIENIIRASNRAAGLISELAGGEIGELIDLYPGGYSPVLVESKDISTKVKRLTGLDVSKEECLRILAALGITQKDELDSPQTYCSPSWRHDIAIEEDLVEEIARHVGYENIANELPPAYGAGEYQPTEGREKLLRQTLIDLGFDEAMSYSFVDTKYDEVFAPVPGVLNEGKIKQLVTLRDSVIDGAVRMRPTLLPGLLEAIRLNLNHQRRDVKLFELGKVYGAAEKNEDALNEQKVLAFVLTGGNMIENHATPLRELDFFDAKGTAEAALCAVGVSAAEFTAADVKHLRKGQTAAILVNENLVGYVGRLNDEIAQNQKFKQPVYVGEVNLSTLLNMEQIGATYKPLQTYPSVTRDVSLIVKRDVPFELIRNLIKSENTPLCRSVVFVDIYEGKGMAEGEHSITIRLEYRLDERTLIENEVESEHAQILASLATKLAVNQRF